SLKDKYARQYAIDSLGEIGPEARSAVPKLLDLFKKDKKESVRHRALVALGKIDPLAPKVLFAFGEGFRDKDGLINQEAEGILIRLGDKGVPTLVNALVGSNREVTRRAIEALAKIGPAAKEA